MAAFCVVSPRSLVEVYRRFVCVCCVHLQGDGGKTKNTHRRENIEADLLFSINDTTEYEGNACCL
jgi:hypothetical protein